MTGLGLLVALAFAPPDSPAQQDPTAVKVVMLGQEDDVSAMRTLIEEYFPERVVAFSERDDLTLDVIVTPTADASPAVARVWLDLRHPGSGATLYIADTKWERVLIRRFEFDGLDAVAREEIGYVVQTTVQAINAGGEIGVAASSLETPAAPPQPEPESPPEQPVGPLSPDPGPEGPGPTPARSPATDPARTRLALDAGYQVHAWAASVMQHGPEGRIAAIVDFPKAWTGASVVVRGYLPVQVERGNLSITLGGAHVGARWLGGVRIAKRLELVGSAGLGLDLIRGTPRALETPAVAAEPTTVVRPVVGGDVGPRLTFALPNASLGIGLMASLMGDSQPLTYIAVDTRDVVFDSWRLHPGALFVVSVATGGPARR